MDPRYRIWTLRSGYPRTQTYDVQGLASLYDRVRTLAGVRTIIRIAEVHEVFADLDVMATIAQAAQEAPPHGSPDDDDSTDYGHV